MPVSLRMAGAAGGRPEFRPGRGWRSHAGARSWVEAPAVTPAPRLTEPATREPEVASSFWSSAELAQPGQPASEYRRSLSWRVRPIRARRAGRGRPRQSCIESRARSS